MKYLENIDYTNVDKTIDFLKVNNLNFYCHKNIVFHVYWFGKLNNNQIISIKSFLATQNLDKCKLFVWLDEYCDFYEKNKLLIPNHKNIILKKFNYFEMTKNTLFENKNYFIENPNLKFRSDISRLLILYHYGGLYYDLDTILLNDFSNILGLEFCYQWSTQKRGNNAILRLNKQSNNCIKIMNKYIIELEHKKRKFSLGFNEFIFNDDLDIYCLPCSFFDPVWILFDNKQKSKYSNLKNFDNFFVKTNENINLSNFFGGHIYAYHWHSRNDFVFEQDSYIQRLNNDINNKIKNI